MIHKLKKHTVAPNLAEFGIPKVTTERFDAFNIDRGGVPAEFELQGRRFQVAVRDCVETPEGIVGRAVEVTEKHLIGGHEVNVLAGFLNDLQIRGEGCLISGQKGWIAVMDYPEIRSGINMGITEGAGVGRALVSYLKKLGDEDKDAEFSRFGYLLNTPIRWKNIPDREKLDVLWQVIQTQDDYTRGGNIFLKIFEFVSMVSPEDTMWVLTSIGHKKTSEKLRGSRPFNKTGFGSLVLKGGWDWDPELKPSRELFEEATSPIVFNRHDFKPSEGWIGMSERLDKMKHLQV